ncbi:MAG: hypothetical protein WCQ99_08280 [Pseudomonadota bacterium]
MKFRRLHALAWFFALLMTLSCSVIPAEKKNPPPGWSASVEEAAGRVLGSLQGKDETMLEAMCINEQEYKSIIWPQLPVSRIPQWETHSDFVWKQHRLRSASGMQKLLSTHGGRKYDLAAVVFKDQPEDHATYKIYLKAMATVTDETGARHDLPLCGSVVELNGFYKIFSYQVN